MRCRAVSVVVLVAGVVVSLAAGSSEATSGRWVVRDLGTLGGPQSEAVAINERGQVVGWSDTKAGDRHAFLWENGTMRDLGTLGGSESEAVAINGRGQVVGWSDTKATYRGSREAVARAFLWEKGRMRDLGTLGGPGSEAVDINERGRVVGTSETADRSADRNNGGKSVSVFLRSDFGWNGSFVVHGFVWEAGKIRDLGTLGGLWSVARAVNERGQIVGQSQVAPKPDYDPSAAFLWENGTMRDLGEGLLRPTPGGDTFRLDLSIRAGPYDLDVHPLNDSGQVLGHLDPREFLGVAVWENGRVRRLGTFTHAKKYMRTCQGFAINERGVVAGSCMDSDASARPVIWKTRTPLDLTNRQIGDRGFATGLNERGQVIGFTTRGAEPPHAFVWANGVMTDLGTLRGGRSAATGINKRGQQIIGTVTTDDAKEDTRAVLWTWQPAK